MSPSIMGLTTKDLYIQKEHTKLYKILKFRVNWANIEQDTAIQKLQNLLTNVWIAGHLSGNPYISLQIYLRWLKTVSNSYIWIGRYNHCLSFYATIMVSKNCPIIGEHVVVIFLTQ